MSHRFTVPDMSCAHCKANIEKALAASGLAASWTVELGAKTVVVESSSDRPTLAAVLTAAGYAPAEA